MNKVFLSLLLISLLIISSCENKENYIGPSTDFGAAEYYKPFLFSKSDTLRLTKSLKYNFNDYAIEKESYIKIKLVDTAQKVLSDKNIQFYINGELIKDNQFDLKSTDSENGTLKIGLELLPDYPDGYTSGFLSISNHSLDMVNNNDLKTSSEKRIFKWEANHKLVMNPLKKRLLWGGIIVIAILLIWFLIFRNMLHPKFKKGKIQILSPYFGGVSFNANTKLIVFTDTHKKQKALNKIFTGKIIYEINSVYTDDIILRPGRGNKIKIKLPIGATIIPAVSNLEKFNSYTIQLNNEEIKIQYS
ncbi:MAG: hypothetical protein ACTHYV_03805 [Psychroflexus sp.]